MLTLYAMGTPMAWHKTYINEENLWVGFFVKANIPSFKVTEDKIQIIDAVLAQWQEGGFTKQKSIHETVARLQWATAACPMAKPFLQPIWAWFSTITESGGRPPVAVKFVAKLLRTMLTQPFRPNIGAQQRTRWYGASDASAREDWTGIGGWITDKKDPQKQEVWWYTQELGMAEHAWIFAHSTGQRRVAAEELFGTLILFDEIKRRQKRRATRLWSYQWQQTIKAMQYRS